MGERWEVQHRRVGTQQARGTVEWRCERRGMDGVGSEGKPTQRPPSGKMGKPCFDTSTNKRGRTTKGIGHTISYFKSNTCLACTNNTSFLVGRHRSN